MASAFMSLLYSILAIAVSIVLFFIGLIVFVRGLLKVPLAQYQGSNTPKAFMIVGGVFMLLPVVTFVVISLWSISSSTSTIFNRMNYQCIPDVWRKEDIGEAQARDDIIRALLTTADKGNRETFSMNFTPELQRQKGFDKAVENFFSSYPVGLSKCDKNDKTRIDTAFSGSGEDVKIDGISFSCRLMDDWYFVCIEYCYRNTDEPDKVGVTDFKVMNLRSAAEYYADPVSFNESRKNTYLLCEMKNDSDADARLIGGRPYLWTSDRASGLTADELRVLLRENPRLDSPALKFRLGEPGVGIKQPDSSEYGYFCEIAAQNGEPRYAYFQTDSEYGSILWALLCTPYKVDYDHPLLEEHSSQK